MPRSATAITLLSDYTPPPFLVDHAALTFDLDAERTEVLAVLQLRRRAPGSGAPLWLDGDPMLTLLELRLEGRLLTAADYTLEADSLTVPDAPDRCELTIRSAFSPRRNTALSGLYSSGALLCTQCEAQGFRRITWFPDRPDVLARYTVTLRADRALYPVLLSNGDPKAAGEMPDGRHYAVWEDPFPKPSYLFALAAGTLACVEDRFRTCSGRDVALRLFVAKGREPLCRHAMDSLKRAMVWDERRFGLEYDLDVFNIVAVPDFNMGAMENKSLNIFNESCILADLESATDDECDWVESVVGHEYFHNWTGNRITCRDWFQLSLKEGLTVFRDQEFIADQHSRAVKRIKDVQSLRLRQFPEDAGPLAHPVRPDRYAEINNFYTATVYQKGAEVVRMLHTLLGEDGFQRGMRLYVARHDGQAVTCDDFVAAMADANSVDLTQFKRWYAQAGTPRLTVTEVYDPAAATLTLTVTQAPPPTPGQPDKAPLYMPLRVAVLDEEGAEQRTTIQDHTAAEHLLVLRRQTERFVFHGVAQRPTLSLNRGFSAPVLVQPDPSAAVLALRMGRDPDAFNRWDAAWSYGSNVLARMIADWRAGNGTPAIDSAFLEALRRIIVARDLDPAFQALLLTLPSEMQLAAQQPTVDPEATHACRSRLRHAAAQAFQDDFQCLYDQTATATAGGRALRNAALEWLAAADAARAPALALAHFEAAAGMTDVIAALRVLTHLDAPQRRQAFDAFRVRWQETPQVMDKWLTLQAISQRPDALAQVVALQNDPIFTLSNPNRVRALIGAFANGNPLRFHAADGSGYGFLADAVLALDALNPQTAAWLLTPLGQWRRLDPDRAEKMRAALHRVRHQPTLSRDTTDIAARALEEEAA